jgi:acyl dehydratase
MAIESQSSQQNVDATVTEETIERLRALMAEEPDEWRPAKRQWHYEATRDTIRHWAWGIGDDNPLWCDDAYGRTTKYGTNLAPPTFLYSAASGPAHENSTGARDGGRGGPLAGIHAVWVGERWRWDKRIVRGSETRASEKRTVDVLAREGRFGGLVAEIVTETRFFDGDGDLLGAQQNVFWHHGRKTAASKGKYSDLRRHVWSEAELAALVDAVDAEVVRGAEDLRWDAVEVGEEIPAVVKGPLSVSEMITFLQGWGGSYRAASEITHKYMRKHPKANVPDPDAHFPDFPGRAHVDPVFARACGFPDAYDIGAQRASWLAHAVTNWMGDNGFLKTLHVNLLRLNIIGDATWVRGTVTGKDVDQDGDRVVHLDLAAVNQRGETTARAAATVVAPR